MEGLFKKFLAFGAGSLITLILGLVTSPIITRLISPDKFGKFSMFNTVNSLIIMVLLLGLDQSYVRFFYEEKEENRKILLRKSIKYPLIFNIFLSLILIVFFRPISNFIIGESSIFLIILLIIMNTSSIFNRFSLLDIRMQQKAKEYSCMQIIGKIIYISMVLALYIYIGNSYNTLIISLIISNIAIAIISIYVEKQHWIGKVSYNNINTSNKELFSYGIPLIFSMAVTWIFQSVDKVFLNYYSGYNEVGLYSAAFSIVALLNAVQNTFTTFWTPVANEHYKNYENDKEFFTRINSIISLVMIFIGIGLITFKDFIVILLGSKYSGTVFIFPFLIFNPIMYTISETTVQGINFKKKSKYYIHIAVTSAFINIIGNYILVPILGAKGAAISTGISYVVFFYLRTIISNKLYKVNYNICKFTISVVLLMLLATYATFNCFDIIFIILSIINIGVVSILYLDTIKYILKMLNKKTIK